MERTNCKNCGAPLPASGICEYCKTINEANSIFIEHNGRDIMQDDLFLHYGGKAHRAKIREISVQFSFSNCPEFSIELIVID